MLNVVRRWRRTVNTEAQWKAKLIEQQFLMGCGVACGAEGLSVGRDRCLQVRRGESQPGAGQRANPTTTLPISYMLLFAQRPFIEQRHWCPLLAFLIDPTRLDKGARRAEAACQSTMMGTLLMRELFTW